MAYTKQPQQSTIQQRRIPAAGNMTPSHSVGQSEGAQFINCSPVTYRRDGMDPLQVVEPRPFLREDSFYEVGSGNGAFRGCTVDGKSGNINTWIARGDGIYRSGLLVYTRAPAFDFPVQFCVTDDYLVWATSTDTTNNIGKIELDLGTATVTSLDGGGQVSVKGAPVAINGYVFYAGSDGNIYNSTLTDPTDVTVSTDFIAAEQYPDDLITLARHRNHVVAFGSQSIEFFYDAGNALGSPLNRQENYAMQVGLVQPYTYQNTLPKAPVVALKDILFFLGKDQVGTISIYAMDNFQVTDIADDFLKKLFQGGAEIGGESPKDPITAIRRTIQMTPIPAYGTTCLYIEFTTEYNDDLITRENHFRMVYNPNNGVWSRWTWNKLDDLGKEYNLITASRVTLESTRSLDRIWCVFTDTTERAHQGYFRAITDGTSTENMLCEITTGLQDFDSYYNKHFISADILGHFDINSTAVGLESSKHTNYTSFVNHGWKVGDFLSDGVARFRNMGVARHMDFKVKIATTSNFQYAGLDVLYNQGSE